jgi:RNA polymerase sigma-70 factor (ECF subfamily)
MKTPASLLQRLRRPGDQEAWSRLVELYLPLVCYWARRAGLQDADVADLSQEVFTTLYHTLPQFTYDPQRSFRGWLRAVTLNKWRELRRRRAAVPGGAALDDMPAENNADLWDADHQRYLVARAFELMRAEFSAPAWRACWETVVEGRTPTEVAQRLGTTVGAVYAARARVLRWLRQELDGML